MTQRLNRNGIPILDPPGQNKLPQARLCPTPEDHDWGPPVEMVSTCADFDYYMEADSSTLYKQTCRKCRTTDTFWRAE